MKEMKIRGKSMEPLVGGNDWVIGFGVHRVELADGGMEAILYTESGTYSVYPDSVGVSIGLEDKAGNELFDQDILEWDEREWGDPYNEEVRWDYDLLSMRKNDWRNFCKVIGNRFDHPELLSNNKEGENG